MDFLGSNLVRFQNHLRPVTIRCPFHDPVVNARKRRIRPFFGDWRNNS
ncbi:DUF723 domain-containing protein [Leptospira saintgironsiae]